MEINAALPLFIVGIIVTIYFTHHLSKGVLYVENTMMNAILRNLIYLYVIF